MTSVRSKSQQERARKLVGSRAARELVPVVPGTSARWHTHDYPGVYCRWHHHPEHEIHLIQHGTGHTIVGDHIGRFQAGSLFLVGSELPHHWISDLPPGGRVADRDVVFQFHPQWLQDCRRLLPELATLDALMDRAARGIEFTGSTAVDAAAELVAIGTSDGIARLQHIWNLLAALNAAPPHEAHLLASPWTPGREGAGAADLVDQTLAYIFDHVSDDVRLAEAAVLAGMSESGFSRYFQRASGQSFTDTVRKLRLTHACHLLEQTDLSVAVVSRRVGYRNLSNFNRQFRATYALTPSEYRRDRRPALARNSGAWAEVPRSLSTTAWKVCSWSSRRCSPQSWPADQADGSAVRPVPPSALGATASRTRRVQPMSSLTCIEFDIDQIKRDV